LDKGENDISSLKKKNVCTVELSTATNPEQKQENENSLPTLGVSALSEFVGVYVNVKINGVNAKFLVDTGSTVTIVSENIWNLIGSLQRHNFVCCLYGSEW